MEQGPNPGGVTPAALPVESSLAQAVAPGYRQHFLTYPQEQATPATLSLPSPASRK
uniref:Uncharacterized protein n=1 Tax=Thermogemmatispora argillosa TaxID=2045280 RepID=A0A455T1G2_9CHLR|nr:hypothetical protein KTA_04740 [Thermogemmatispora argillosa]